MKITVLLQSFLAGKKNKNAHVLCNFKYNVLNIYYHTYSLPFTQTLANKHTKLLKEHFPNGVQWHSNDLWDINMGFTQQVCKFDKAYCWAGRFLFSLQNFSVLNMLMTSPVRRSQKKTKHTVHVSPTHLATGPFFFGKPITVP